MMTRPSTILVTTSDAGVIHDRSWVGIKWLQVSPLQMYQDQIGLLPDFQRADLVIKAHDFSAAHGGEPECFGRGQGLYLAGFEPHRIEGVAHSFERVVHHPVGRKAYGNTAPPDAR